MHIKNKSNNVWNVGTPDEKKVSEIASALGISEFLSRIIVSKGFTEPEEAKSFLYGSTEMLYDPYLMPDMDKAVERVRRAVADKEKILIYGDYDVDGVTSVALLLMYLKSIGGVADYYIPERVNEGYGLNNAAIDRIKADGVSLIITVDSGITAENEVEYASSLGIDVVITDHHECRENLPKAVAVVNPHRQDSVYPFAELAGVGVVFKLVCAMEDNKNVSRLCQKYCDIVALGTVADVMPIIGENRVIVKIGLEQLENTSNFGLKALTVSTFSEKRSAKNKKLTASSISFGLAPRINAAGRIGNVNKAVQLLITDNKQEAENIADYLCSVNRERQLIENEIFEQAINQIDGTVDYDDDKIIVLSSDSWHLGVIGIVASKITERYGLPSILISFDGDTGKGSGRSIKGFNINEAISQCKELLIKYGGHELAAGLTIQRENVGEFRKRINDYAKNAFDFDNVRTYINADFEIGSADITVQNALEISRLEPYGVQNPEPLFCMKNVLIREIYPIGEGRHLKLILEKDGITFNAVYFGMTRENFPYPENTFADFMFNLSYNDFRGDVTAQIIVKDVRLEEAQYRQKLGQEELFADVMSGKIPCPEEHLPTLNNFRTIFLYLKNTIKTYDKYERISVWNAAGRINSEFMDHITPCMLNIALEVFEEMNLIKLDRRDCDSVEVRLVKSAGKVDLNNSTLLRKIKSNT